MGRSSPRRATTNWPPSCCGARKPRPSGGASRCGSAATTAGRAHSPHPSRAAICSRSKPGPISSQHGARSSCSSARRALISRLRLAKDANFSRTQCSRYAAPNGSSIARAATSTAPRTSKSCSSEELAAAVAASDPRGDLTRSAAVPARHRPAAGARRRLVRDGAAQPGHGPGQTRHVRRLHRAPAGNRRARLRRALFHADPSDRHDQPQGQEQFAEGAARRSRQPLCHRQRSRAATTPCIPNSARSTTSAAWSRPAARIGMEVALDFAIQCSPDHPWLKEHPDWFKRRPDGSIHYAENPPKKYEDIVNPDFYCADRIALWQALRDVILFWVEQGVRIFRVDNPHTKPFPFWEWLIHEVQTRDPNVIFLSEAFTRPKIMKGWPSSASRSPTAISPGARTRPNSRSISARSPAIPSAIISGRIFSSARPTSCRCICRRASRGCSSRALRSRRRCRPTTASTTASNCSSTSRSPAARNIINSEKYEIKVRDWNKPGNIKGYIGRLNRIRRDNAALLQTANLRFAQVDDAEVIGFVKESAGRRQRRRGGDCAQRPRPAHILVPLRRDHHRSDGARAGARPSTIS